MAAPPNAREMTKELDGGRSACRRWRAEEAVLRREWSFAFARGCSGVERRAVTSIPAGVICTCADRATTQPCQTRATHLTIYHDDRQQTFSIPDSQRTRSAAARRGGQPAITRLPCPSPNDAQTQQRRCRNRLWGNGHHGERRTGLAAHSRVVACHFHILHLTN